MNLECVYLCRYCQSSFVEIIETNEPLEAILLYLSSYNFMYKPHKCETGDSGLAKRMKGVIGIADLRGFKPVEGEDVESIHSNNQD